MIQLLEKPSSVNPSANSAPHSATNHNGQSEIPSVEPSNRLALVSWLFLIGSLIFTIDSGLEMLEGISLHAVFHLSASLLFTFGSVLFLPSSQSK